jgi:hypothetical protein
LYRSRARPRGWKTIPLPMVGCPADASILLKNQPPLGTGSGYVACSRSSASSRPRHCLNGSEVCPSCVAVCSCSTVLLSRAVPSIYCRCVLHPRQWGLCCVLDRKSLTWATLPSIPGPASPGGARPALTTRMGDRGYGAEGRNEAGYPLTLTCIVQLIYRAAPGNQWQSRSCSRRAFEARGSSGSHSFQGVFSQAFFPGTVDAESFHFSQDFAQ